jgi:Ceramidase
MQSSMPSPRALTRNEIFVALTLIVFAAIWLFVPAVTQPENYFPFADQRSFLAIPNAADVLSNLAFVVVGALGLYRLQLGQRPLEPVARLSLNVFFVGLLFTGFGSAYFHWDPTNETLVGDRLPMTIAFAGVFGTLLAERISTRSGMAVLLLMLVVGPTSVLYWKATGDLSLYAVVQFGGMAAILLLLTMTAKSHDPFPWWSLMAWYGFAKVLEAGDVFVWNATREAFAGHALKHLAAAMGGLAIASALVRPVPAARVRA